VAIRCSSPLPPNSKPLSYYASSNPYARHIHTASHGARYDTLVSDALVSDAFGSAVSAVVGAAMVSPAAVAVVAELGAGALGAAAVTVFGAIGVAVAIALG
jgi:hypothetical protein